MSLKQVKKAAVVVLTDSQWAALSTGDVVIEKGAVVITVPDSSSASERLAVFDAAWNRVKGSG